MVETVISIRTARLGDERRHRRGARRRLARGLSRRHSRPRARADDRAPRPGLVAPRDCAPARRCSCSNSAIRSPAMSAMGATACPRSAFGGEIFELYLAPECQGCGLGRRMFEAARKDLAATVMRRSSSGRWRTTNGRSASIAGSAGASCGGRMKLSADRTASASLSALAEFGTLHLISRFGGRRPPFARGLAGHNLEADP